jgi:hypothetical protein
LGAAVSPKQKILNHRDTENTEVCHRESPGASSIGKLIGMRLFTSMQGYSEILVLCVLGASVVNSFSSD